MFNKKSNLTKISCALLSLSLSINAFAQEEVEYVLPDPYFDTSQGKSEAILAAPMALPDDTDTTIEDLFLLQERNRVPMHSVDSFMGDSIDGNTGSLSFHHTDIAIPGNFDLPVKISRQIPTGTSPLYQLKNWVLDVPYISRRLGHIWLGNRCSEMMPIEENENVTAIHFFQD